MTDDPIPNIKRRGNAAAGKMPAAKRSRRALLGEIYRIGIVPVYAWVEHDRLYFHKLHDREDPAPIPLAELYQKVSGYFPI